MIGDEANIAPQGTPWTGQGEGMPSLFFMTSTSPSLALMRPHFLKPSPSLVALPFMLWLVEAARPQVMVQLGLGSGTGYFGLCQALERLREGTTCLGFALPEGEERAAVPPELAAYNSRYYREFSFLSCEGTQNEGSPADIDLLIVESGSDDALGARLASWLPRLSKRGVIVLSGGAMAALDEGHPVIRPDKGEGPRAVLYGSDFDEPTDGDLLRRIASDEHSSTKNAVVWRFLSRLGEGLLAEAEAEAGKAALSDALDRARVVEAGRKEARAAHAQCQERLAEIEANMFDIESRAASTDDAHLAERVEDLELEIVSLRKSEAARFRELAILTRMIEERDARIAVPKRRKDKWLIRGLRKLAHPTKRIADRMRGRG